MHIQEGKKIFLTVLTLSQQGKKKQTRKSPKITKEEESTIKQHLYLDSFNQVSSAVCNFLGRLHEVSLGNRICCFWWSNATSVAQSRRVFGHDRGSWQDLQKPAQNRQCQRGRTATTLQLCNVSAQSQAAESDHNTFDWTRTKQSPVPWQGWSPAILCHHLRWAARWIDQVLARHLDRLVGTGKLNWVNEALLTSLAVWIWDTHQVSSLEMEKRRKQS